MQEPENIPNAQLGGVPRVNSDLLWYVSCFLITATAVFLRFVSLTLKPLHHDEGVNGWFLTNLFRDGRYAYDPANYHGPTLFYISLYFIHEMFFVFLSLAIVVAIVFFIEKRSAGIFAVSWTALILLVCL